VAFEGFCEEFPTLRKTIAGQECPGRNLDDRKWTARGLRACAIPQPRFKLSGTAVCWGTTFHELQIGVAVALSALWRGCCVCNNSVKWKFWRRFKDYGADPSSDSQFWLPMACPSKSWSDQWRPQPSTRPPAELLLPTDSACQNFPPRVTSALNPAIPLGPSIRPQLLAASLR